MMGSVKNLYLLVLVVMISLGAGTFLLLHGFPQYQLVIGITTAVFYSIWGLLYQRTKGGIHIKVVIEYLLVSAIAILLLFIVVGP